jgi:hypothetical protein
MDHTVCNAGLAIDVTGFVLGLWVKVGAFATRGV